MSPPVEIAGLCIAKQVATSLGIREGMEVPEHYWRYIKIYLGNGIIALQQRLGQRDAANRYVWAGENTIGSKNASSLAIGNRIIELSKD